MGNVASCVCTKSRLSNDKHRPDTKYTTEKKMNSDMNTKPILELGRRNRLVMVLGGGW
jgi:hypothetical protein